MYTKTSNKIKNNNATKALNNFRFSLLEREKTKIRTTIKIAT